jgi:glutamyl-Q tRNA(Asp) synthetase
MTPYKATRGQGGTEKNAKIVVSRFAPSPTGRLHLGHAYSALKAHDFARQSGGQFLLRIEDIDANRCREEFVEAIFEDLSWLGISWDGDPIRQSARLPRYAEALDDLLAQGLAYPCFCTRTEIAREIAASAAAPHGPDGPHYPGTCRSHTPEERERRMATEPHAWRLDMAKALAQAERFPPKEGEAHPSHALIWTNDSERIQTTPEIFGDVVLARKDAPTSYHLAVVVDDAAQGVTHVIRGADLYASTHIHRLLQALLGLPTPHYYHHPLLTDVMGKRLAKRTGATTLADLRSAGADPARLAENLRRGILPAEFTLQAS